MEERTMPLVTFRDDTTGEQVTVLVDAFSRKAGKPDHYHPWPTSNGVRMRAIQIQYQAAV